MWLLSCSYCRGYASMLCVSCIYMRVPVDADTARRADGKSAGMTADCGPMTLVLMLMLMLCYMLFF